MAKVWTILIPTRVSEAVENRKIWRMNIKTHPSTEGLVYFIVRYHSFILLSNLYFLTLPFIYCFHARIIAQPLTIRFIKQSLSYHYLKLLIEANQNKNISPFPRIEEKVVIFFSLFCHSLTLKTFPSSMFSFTSSLFFSYLLPFTIVFKEESLHTFFFSSFSHPLT